ncbi:TraX protein [compost metagenome]
MHATTLPVRDPALDLLKWLAMLCMVLDHLRYAGWPQEWLYVPGRLAFPWFCLAIAANLARRRDASHDILRWRYLGWLLLFAIISQLPYRWFQPLPAIWNVLPTLALGLLLANAFQVRTRSAVLAGLAALVLAVVMQRHLMFGLPGVLLPLATLAVLSRPGYWALLPGVLCLAGNVWPMLLDAARHGDPAAYGGIAACLLGPWLGMALLKTSPPVAIPPMRRWAYAIYPLHFLLLIGLRKFI